MRTGWMLLLAAALLLVGPAVPVSAVPVSTVPALALSSSTPEGPPDRLRAGSVAERPGRTSAWEEREAGALRHRRTGLICPAALMEGVRRLEARLIIPAGQGPGGGVTAPLCRYGATAEAVYGLAAWRDTAGADTAATLAAARRDQALRGAELLREGTWADLASGASGHTLRFRTEGPDGHATWIVLWAVDAGPWVLRITAETTEEPGAALDRGMRAALTLAERSLGIADGR